MTAARHDRPPADVRAPGLSNAGLELAVPPEFVEAVALRAAALVAERLEPRPVPYLDVAGAAEYLVAPRSRIYALVSAGRIPHRRDGSRLLFRAAELDEWLDQGGGRRP